MSTFAQTLAAGRRLFVLQTLIEAGGSANDTILRDACRAGFHAHGITRAVMRDDLTWLEQRGCVRLTWIRDGEVIRAALTERGEDVSRGDAQVPGIAAPPVAS